MDVKKVLITAIASIISTGFTLITGQVLAVGADDMKNIAIEKCYGIGGSKDWKNLPKDICKSMGGSLKADKDTSSPDESLIDVEGMDDGG